MSECVVEGCDRPQEFEEHGDCIVHAAETWVEQNGSDGEICDACAGLGEITVVRQDQTGYTKRCRRCHGDGVVSSTDTDHYEQN